MSSRREAPPRPPPSRTTEQQQAEQAMRRRILHDASERLINVSSPRPFTSSRDSLPPSRSPSPSSPPSRGSSPTLTSPSRRHTPRSRSRASTWRPPADGPLAPVRVVHLGQNWQVLNPEGALAEHGPGAGASQSTPATKRGTRRGGGAGKTASRPPSSHSMRTLPRGGGGGQQPSPLRRDLGGLGSDTVYRDEEDEYEEDDDGADVESRFGTMTSYRTANSGVDDAGVSSSYGTTRTGVGLRDMWGAAMGEDPDAVDDPARKEELARALAALESSIDTWTLHPVGPIVADLDQVAAMEERGTK
ncbi:hypothetical protein JCM21900_002085 [Sporobolomyces salmonicolor]